MTWTTTHLASYLGKQSRELLAKPPFSKWTCERTVEEDVRKPRIDYVFELEGIDCVCDIDESLRTIFVYNEPTRRFTEGLDDLPFSLSRQDVQDQLGCPSKSGEPMNDSILGQFGAWDRFEYKQFSVHV